MDKYDSTKQPHPKFLGYAYEVAKATGCVDHEDAGETAIFARQIEYIYAQTYNILYPELKARKFVPVDTSVPNGADTYTYRAFDQFGVAKMIANYAEDLPDVTTLGKEYTAKCKSMGAAYSYSLQDVRRAMMANMPLEATLAQVARRVVEVLHDKICAFGDTPTGLTGFLNNSNVPLVTPITGNWDLVLGATTPIQVLNDLNKLANSIPILTKEIHQPDTLLLDTANFVLLSATPLTTTYPDISILKYFLTHNLFVKQVDSWTLLNTADAGGTRPRAVCYQRSEQNLGYVLPQEFEQLPPQPKALGWTVPCHSRSGGVKFTYPLSCAYMDGIHS